MSLRILLTSTLMIVAAAVAVAPASAGSDGKRPRIVSAVLRDADGDFRAERVRLRYSERIRHAADSDGTYPFRVAGYRIRSVRKAAGRVLVLRIAEKVGPDHRATPSIRYRRTKAKPVRDRSGKQAAAQTFRRVRAHRNAPPRSDRDGDGSPNGHDCAPYDATIHPGALDKPDLRFVDRNCDGIDGDKSRAVFVAPTAAGGNDANSGAFGQPKATVPSAIAAAEAAVPVKDVYVATGVYPGAVTLADRVGIYGAYHATGWSRSLSGGSSVLATGTAASAQNVKVVLQLMTFSGLTPAIGSAYGLRAVSSTLALERVTLAAGAGVSGGSGTTHPGRAPGGDEGERGDPGAEDSTFPCSDGNKALGGAGGNAFDPIVVRRGGEGGGAGHGGFEGFNGLAGGGPGGAVGGLRTPVGRGDWDTPSLHWGHTGNPGAAGSSGGAGSGVFTSAGYTPSSGGAGGSGGPGRGGGGGGGGGGGDDSCNSWGGGGGGGGGGGLGGVGGGGGQSGGGAFALYLWASTVSATDSSFLTAKGGDGGAGGQGQLGGLGGKGGRRSDTHGAGNVYGGGGGQDDGSNGGKGGDGGDGGTGGRGGGGAGGPSIGALVGGGSIFSSSGSSFAVGTGGAGGSSPGGNPGPAGVRRNVFSP